MQTTANTNTANTIRVYQDPKAAHMPSANERMITARFRAPARSATVIIPATAWTTMDTQVPQQYASLLAAVLETAAKSILSKRLADMAVWPSEIDSQLFTSDAILAEASGANTDWLTREELASLWEQSATRKGFISNPNYQANKAYRVAVDAYKELVLKLAGKTSQYQEAELDRLLAKLNPEDFESELGAFIVKRVEQIKNRPQKSAVDLDLL